MTELRGHARLDLFRLIARHARVAAPQCHLVRSGLLSGLGVIAQLEPIFDRQVGEQDGTLHVGVRVAAVVNLVRLQPLDEYMAFESGRVARVLDDPYCRLPSGDHLQAVLDETRRVLCLRLPQLQACGLRVCSARNGKPDAIGFRVLAEVVREDVTLDGSVALC